MKLLRDQYGFSLLEAVVALAVLAMSAMALYGWLNSNLILLKRVDGVYQSAEVVESALEWISVLDPFADPSGEREIAGALVRWAAVPVGNSLQARDMNGNRSVNDAQLFRVQVEIHRGERRLAHFEVMQLGLQPRRQVEELIF